jgi:hypothetical protein
MSLETRAERASFPGAEKEEHEDDRPEHGGPDGDYVEDGGHS